MKGLRQVWRGVVLALLSYWGNVRLAGARRTPAISTSEPVGDECWVFAHLNKAGGSTVKSMLKDMWGPRYFTYGGAQWNNGDMFSQSVAEDLVHGQNLSVVGGGYVEALRRSSDVDSQCKWFTVFRHPISRLVSAYYFCKVSRSCASQLLDAKNVDITTFAKHWGNYAVRQFVLSFVSIDHVLEYSKTDAVKQMLPETVKRPGVIPGWFFVKLYLENHTLAPINKVLPDGALYAMLQPVQDLLRDNYSAVGILEEYNTTLSVFNAALDMPRVDWHETFKTVGHVNVNNKYQDEKTATLAEAWTNSEIKKYLQLDLLLYEHAVVLFHQQARAYDI